MLLNVPFLYWIHEEPSDFYRYTEFALKYLLGKVGFKNIKFEFIGSPVEVIADIIIKNTAHIPLLGDPLAIFLQCFTLFFNKTGFGRKVKDIVAYIYPLGYFVIAEKLSFLLKTVFHLTVWQME